MINLTVFDPFPPSQNKLANAAVSCSTYSFLAPIYPVALRRSGFSFVKSLTPCNPRVLLAYHRGFGKVWLVERICGVRPILTIVIP
jgi:hypothetical protein